MRKNCANVPISCEAGGIGPRTLRSQDFWKGVASYVIVSLPYSMLKQAQLQLADASFRDHDHGLTSKKPARNKEMKTHKEDKVTKR